MNNSTEVNWDAAIWQEINNAILQEMHKTRIAQKVFPTIILDNDPTQIQDEVIDFNTYTIREGTTKPFIEIYLEFSLTSAQVAKEAQLKTCKTLARMAAKQIALAEDMIIFQGTNGVLPGNVVADQRNSAGLGILGNAPAPNVVNVSAPAVRKPTVLYGENTFGAVTDGISILTANAQAPNFALCLPSRIYADTFEPPGDQSLITTAERIKPLVEGGFHGTATLPQDVAAAVEGFLVALAGDPITLYVGREAQVEYVRKAGSQYYFRVTERIQFVIRDPRAIIGLNFLPIPVAVAAPAAAVPAPAPAPIPVAGGDGNGKKK